MLKEALPADAKAAFERDQAAKEEQQEQSNETNASTRRLSMKPNLETMLTTEEVETLKKQRRYYIDAIQFAKQIDVAIPILLQLLASKIKTDVLESIAFFVEAYRHGVPAAQQGIRRLIHLIWSKDTGDQETKSIREHVLLAFQALFLDVDAPTETDRTRFIVRHLISLTTQCSLADLTSLEQVLALCMARGMLPDPVLTYLWSLYGSTREEREVPPEVRRGAILVLGMLAKGRPGVLEGRVPLLLRIGFGEVGGADMTLARYTCMALVNMAPGKGKGVSVSSSEGTGAFQRLEMSHLVFRRAVDFLLKCNSGSWEWFNLAERVINMIYALAEHPDVICSRLVRLLAVEALPSTGQAASSCRVFSLSQLFFTVGHVAIKQIAHLELIEGTMKRCGVREQSASATVAVETKAGKSKKGKKVQEREQKEEAEDDELDAVVGSCEDEIADRMMFIREKELLYGGRSLIAKFAPMIAFVCSNSSMYQVLL